MKDKIVLITGANSGIGKEATRALAKKGTTIIMACRNLEKAEPVCEMIQTEGAQASIYLASSGEVKGITGKYFAKKRIKAASKKCSDIKLQKELWQVSEQLTGIK